MPLTGNVRDAFCGTLLRRAGEDVQLQCGTIVGEAFQLFARKLLDDVFHNQLALGAKGAVLVSFKFLEQIDRRQRRGTPDSRF